jgi:hypothetical protein
MAIKYGRELPKLLHRRAVAARRITGDEAKALYDGVEAERKRERRDKFESEIMQLAQATMRELTGELVNA